MTDKPRRNRRFTVDDLFTDTRARATGVSDLANARLIELTRIEPDPEQPRRYFDDARMAELADAIRAEGVLQPIVVRYEEARDVYIIVHGERRWRASQIAEVEDIPALIRDVPEHRRLVQQLMENIVRDDLNAIDRAAALRALRQQMGDAPWEDVAAAVGIKRSRLFQLLGTEKLPEAAQQDIQRGALSEKQSRALQGLLPAHQEALRALIVERDLPAATASKISRALRSSGSTPASHAQAQADVLQLYALLEPADMEALIQQTHTLLMAVQQAQATEVAKVLGVPRFDEHRLAKEVSAIAKTLTRTDSTQLTMSEQSRVTLQELRDAIDAILQRAR